MQAMGRFVKYSKATILNSTVVTILIYPLILLVNLFGLVISNLFGILSLTIRYVLPMNKEYEGYEASLDRNDFNLPILVLGNFTNIIIVLTRFISGSDGSNNIAYYTYSVFILNTILTAVIGNLTTLLLRKISIDRNNRIMLISLAVSILVGLMLILFLYFFSYDLIELFFHRGKFNLLDVQKTSSYLLQLIFAFMLMFIATTLFQPFFSLNKDVSVKERKYIFLCFISSAVFSLVLISFLSFDVRFKSLIYIYVMTILSVILSVYSYFIFLRNVE